MGEFKPLNPANANEVGGFLGLRGIPESFRRAPWQPAPQAPQGEVSNREELTETASADVESPPPVDVEELREAAFAAGLEQGRQEAAEAEEATAELTQLVRDLVGELQSARTEALKQASADISTIVLAVTKRALRGSLAVHPAALSSIISDALAMLPEDEEIWIDVNPDDTERVESLVPDSRHAHVVPDEAITGGCRVRTRYAAIERTVETVLDNLGTAIDTWRAEQ